MSFQSPNYTQAPNDLFDDLLKEIDELSEMKVTLAAVRQTFGYHRDQAEMSLSWFEAVTGLSRNSVRRGIEKAIERGTLAKVKDETSRDGAVYSMVVEGQPLTPRGSAVAPLEGQPLTPLKKEKKAELAAESENPKPEEPSADVPNVYAAYFSVYVQHLSLQRDGELIEIFDQYPLEWQKEALKRAFSKEQELAERWYASRRLSYAIPMLREWKTHGAVIEKSNGRGGAGKDQSNNFKVVRTPDGGFF